MNHKYKALIKQEIKGVRWLFIYFCLLFVMLTVNLSGRLNARYLVFMERGISTKGRNFYNFLSTMSEEYFVFVGALIIGVVMLINIQFKDYKSGEVGRFLKGLPVKSEKHFLIKVGCGIVSYTIPFVLYAGAVYWLKYIHLGWMQAVCNVTPLSEVWGIVNGNVYIGKVLLTYYLMITMIYLFLMLMQYLVMWPKVSLVIGGIITLVPYYFAHMLYMSVFERNRSYFEETLFLPWSYGNPGRSYGYGGSSGFDVQIDYIEFLEVKIMVLLILSIAFLGIAYKLSKNFKIEKLDILMPSKIMRVVFCVGVAVCSLLLPNFMRDYFIMAYDSLSIQIIVSSIVCLIIGYIVSRQISKLGDKKRGDVGYEKI